MAAQEDAVGARREEEGADDIVDLLKALAVAAGIALLVRSFLFDPFNIPSASMVPTLQVGDYLFVEKYAYGYSRYSFPLDLIPFSGRFFEKQVTRGDIAVFRQPKKTNIDYIKRIVGLPGDKIQVSHGILRINDVPVARDFRGSEDYTDGQMFHVYKRYIETLPNDVNHYIYEFSDEGPLDDTPVYTVPPGYYFAMGDNRDSSQDSRVQSEVGFVPAENMIGRASFIFFSIESLKVECSRDGRFAAVKSLGCDIVEIPKAIRFSRIFKSVNAL